MRTLGEDRRLHENWGQRSLCERGLGIVMTGGVTSSFGKVIFHAQ